MLNMIDQIWVAHFARRLCHPFVQGRQGSSDDAQDCRQVRDSAAMRRSEALLAPYTFDIANSKVGAAATTRGGPPPCVCYSSGSRNSMSTQAPGESASGGADVSKACSRALAVRCTAHPLQPSEPPSLGRLALPWKVHVLDSSQQ